MRRPRTPSYSRNDSINHFSLWTGAERPFGSEAAPSNVSRRRRKAARGGPTRCCGVVASLAAASLVLVLRCGAFHVHTLPRPRTHNTAAGIDSNAGYRYRYRNSARAMPGLNAVAPERVASPATTRGLDEAGDTSAVLDDLARVDIDAWEGHERGFDWYLEQARRGMTRGTAGFSPLRMAFWRPAEEEAEELKPWDSLYIILRNVAQMVGLPSLDGAPMAKIEPYKGSWWTFLQKVSNGRLEELAGGPLFLMLEKYFLAEGPVYKLAFGPRSFIVVSDPVMAKHVLRSGVTDYDKGVLASILQPIMGKGLIPADPETWKIRRRAIVPGFHKAWLNRMVRLFAECADTLVVEAQAAAKSGEVLDMEEKFCSLSLDIIGRAVFNFEFGSVSEESPVIKAVYRVLREAEHRSSSFIPYWKLPFARRWIASQAEFSRDIELLNAVLDELIQKALKTQQTADLEELERRDLDTIEDPSLLRFLIDMRGEDTTSKQLRDDLMTMLIAGHETTAAMLTWTMFNLAQNPEILAKIHKEIDECLGPDEDRVMTFDDLPNLLYTRLALVEALRLYPEPPVLIRRALKETELPQGGGQGPVKLVKGTDVFISTWNLHRSPALWDRPAEYRPERFLSEFRNPDVTGWKGFTPKIGSGLYPSEIDADFAFLPFGGGNRKCVGDQFAMMEATVTLAMLLKKVDLTLVGLPEDVGMVTGATIHTANGLKMRTALRKPSSAPSLPVGGGGELRNGHGAKINGHDASGAADSLSGVKLQTVSIGNPDGGQGKGKCPMHDA